jgi:hypothetical protein
MLFEKNLSPPFCSVALYGKFEKDITKRERERESSLFILVSSAFPHLHQAATHKSCQLYR